MRKIRKYLMTSLSLGLAGISVGAIATGCANAAAENNNPDPASQNSITTNPGDPLTKEQMDYHQNLAAEIKTQFDTNEKLDYSKPEDKAKIDSEISTYEEMFENSLLKSQIDKIEKYSNSKDISGVNDYARTSYENFRQKNLLPTSKDVLNMFSGQTGSELNNEISWYVPSFYVSLFYSYAKIIIITIQLNLISNPVNLTSNTTEPLNSFIGIFYTCYDMTIPNVLDKESSQFKALQYYQKFLLDIKNSIDANSEISNTGE